MPIYTQVIPSTDRLEALYYQHSDGSLFAKKVTAWGVEDIVEGDGDDFSFVQALVINYEIGCLEPCDMESNFVGLIHEGESQHQTHIQENVKAYLSTNAANTPRN